MVQFNDSFSGDRINDLRANEEERFVQAMAPKHGFEYIDLRGYTINPEGLGTIPETKAIPLNMVCFDIKQNNLLVAAKNPTDPKVQELLNDYIQRQYTITLYICSSNSLKHAWERYKDVVDSTLEKRGVLEISPVDIIKMKQEIKAKEDVTRLITNINKINNVRRISSTIEIIFAGALALRASDIHIEPEEKDIRLRYRFDGVLHDIADLDPYIYERMMSRLKLISGMVLNSKKTAQDGRFTFTMGDQEIEIRSSIIPGSQGESIVMRVLDPGVASFSMENLKLNPYVEAAIRTELKKPNGLIVTTGPTGSGKTTALYAFLRETHEEGVKIITIENPVEYKLEGIVQTQIGEDYTFAAGLRAVLRQDPDIIMIGEVRDLEVAETAIHAAQTGHLVFTTLHTNSAAAGFPRLMDMGIDPRTFGTSLNIMLGQRLVRVLCTDCKQGYKPSLTEVAILKNVMASHPYTPTVPEDVTIYRSVGCSVCDNTGFKGRASIFEGIIMDEAVEEAVLRDPREHVILDAARPQKIPSMVEDGVEKVIQGITSLSELARVVELPQVSPMGEVKTDVATIPAKDDDDFLAHTVTL